MFQTHHQVVCADARRMDALADESVQLVVTSPPYPMIAMWDELFAGLSDAVRDALAQQDGPAAFAAMHQVLDPVWAECRRVLSPGGFACINIGDATRTVDNHFRLFSNHSRILTGMEALGFSTLPDVLWRKPTNAPNKFMGSGMLPAGAYVTYEHEYILIFRKGNKRTFSRKTDKERRRRSAFFWEERNRWFSDVWMDLRGTGQALADPESRTRSAAFPLELAHRLVQMFSLHGDVVLDPFAGTGTTGLAAAATGRSSVGLEKDPALARVARTALQSAPAIAPSLAQPRLAAHRAFVAARTAAGKPPGHHNDTLECPVITRQETGLCLVGPHTVQTNGDGWVMDCAPITETPG